MVCDFVVFVAVGCIFCWGGMGGGYDFKPEINPLHVEKQIPANHDKFQ